MKTTLYQFPISHYCEKARWALDYKGASYSKKNLLPGLHMKTTRKLARHSSVPILDHGGTIVQGSSEIISYLDKTLPERLLTPVNPAEAQLVREWERYLDEEVGVLVEGLVNLLEPLMVVCLGLIVGFIVIALFMPLIKLLNDLS